ncbi:MAG: LysR family transcriptional regulator [Burkholderiaceae bacterium]
MVDPPERPSASQLRAFTAVARTRGFSKAASVLGVTQPAVTAQIRALETHYRVRLFSRTGRGVSLTPIGRRLFEVSDRLDALERTVADILAASSALRGGSLRIAAGAPAPAMRLAAAFAARHPGVSLSMEFGNWHEVVSAIYEQRADIGVLTCAPTDDRVTAQPYLSQRLVALVPAAHPLARHKSARLRDLAGDPVIFRTPQSLTQRTIEAELRSQGLSLQPSMTLDSREAVIEAVRQGVGVGFIFDAASSRTEGISRIALLDFPQRFSEDVFCLSSEHGRAAVDAFLQVAAITGTAQA